MWALFLDTNILLHYRQNRDIDWRGLCGGESIKLCICITVIHELDKKKTDPRLRDRARRAIDEIRELSVDGNCRDGVVLEIQHAELRRDSFPHGFDPDSADDAIILHSQKYQEEHPSERTAVVSEDLGMEIKCKARAITLVKPNLSDRLDEPLSEQAKLLRQAQQELLELKNRQPDLVLVMATQEMVKAKIEASSLIDITLKKRPPSPPLDIEALKRELHHLHPDEANRPTPTFAALSGHYYTTIPDTEYDRYNNGVDAYLSAYPKYWKQREKYFQIESLSFTVLLAVRNTGGEPADNLNVHLHIPDGMLVMEPEKFKLYKPSEPSMPAKPVSSGELISRNIRAAGNFSFPTPHLPKIPTPMENVSTPRIRKGNSHDVDYSIRHLKHGYLMHMGSLCFVMDDWNAAKSFNANYSITADNLLKRVTGELVFKITVVE